MHTNVYLEYVTMIPAEQSPETFNTTENTTEENSTYLNDNAEENILVAISLLISFFGLFGNGLVFWCLCFQIKRNRFTVYILHLSVADFMCLFVYSSLLVCMIIDLKLQEVPVVLIITLEVFFIFVYNTNLYLLTAISFERCLSALYPMWYQCKRPKHQSAIVCVVLWLISCFATLLEYFLCTEPSTDALENTSCNLGLFVFMCLINFLVFIPVMIICNLILLIQVQRKSLKHHASNVYIAISITVFVFLVSAVPPRLVSLLQYHDLVNDKIFKFITVLCSCINSSSNPFIYFFVGWRKKLGCKGCMKDVLKNVFKD